jgi:hypothetical protein
MHSAINAYGEVERVPPDILTSALMEVSGQLHTSAALYPEKETPVLTGLEAEWTPDRGGLRIGTVELQHPPMPLDIIDFFLNSLFILVQYIILKLVCFLLHNFKTKAKNFLEQHPH